MLWPHSLGHLPCFHSNSAVSDSIGLTWHECFQWVCRQIVFLRSVMQPPCGGGRRHIWCQGVRLEGSLGAEWQSTESGLSAECRKRLHCAGLGVAARKTVVAVYMLSNFNMDLTLRMACALTTISHGSNGYPRQRWSKRCCWQRRCQIWPLWMTQLHAKRKPSWPKQPRSSGSMSAIRIIVKHLLRWTRFWSGRRPSMARSWRWVCQTNAWSISGCSAGGLGGASAGRCWSKLLAETPLYCATKRGPANLQHFVFFFGLGGSIFGAGMWPQKWVPIMFHACISLLNPGWAVPFLGPESGTKNRPPFSINFFPRNYIWGPYI